MFCRMSKEHSVTSLSSAASPSSIPNPPLVTTLADNTLLINKEDTNTTTTVNTTNSNESDSNWNQLNNKILRSKSSDSSNLGRNFLLFN